MFSTDSRQGYYPFLIHLFYTNLTYKDNDDNIHIYSLVKGVNIKLSPKFLGRIFLFHTTAYLLMTLIWMMLRSYQICFF